MSDTDRHRWNEKYASLRDGQLPEADDWLCACASPLAHGRALELACGIGQNSIWLARHGWQVDAVDISTLGIEIAQRHANRHRVTVNWIAADLDDFLLPEDAYDLVVVFRFLERRTLPERIERALRPGGRLAYETFTAAHLTRSDSHMKNPAFALAAGELPRLFPKLVAIESSECELPDRTVARWLAMRPLESNAVSPIVESTE